MTVQRSQIPQKDSPRELSDGASRWEKKRCEHRRNDVNTGGMM